MKHEHQSNTNMGPCSTIHSEESVVRQAKNYMPNCYFPQSSNADEWNRLVNSEYDRITKLVIRERCASLDESCPQTCSLRQMLERARPVLEQEIRRRIRRDGYLFQLTLIRKQLTSSILDTVRRNKGYIDTFYLNENEDKEYDESPIVVSYDSSAFARYGGYEAATLYGLFMKGGALYCTLNGESGENFYLPIDAIQIEGLVVITHWLTEYGFLVQNDEEILVCDECGSLDIQQLVWVEPNTHEYIGATEYDKDDNWCGECDDHLHFTSLREFKERMQAWWDSTDFRQMERITGFREADFPAEEGNQAFVDACESWWNEKSYDEKRAIWKQNQDGI